MRDFLWRLAIRWQIFWMEMDELGREVLAGLRVGSVNRDR